MFFFSFFTLFFVKLISNWFTTYLFRLTMIGFLFYNFLYTIDGFRKTEKFVINRNFRSKASLYIYLFACDNASKAAIGHWKKLNVLWINPLTSMVIGKFIMAIEILGDVTQTLESLIINEKKQNCLDHFLNLKKSM